MRSTYPNIRFNFTYLPEEGRMHSLHPPGVQPEPHKWHNNKLRLAFQ